MTELSNSKFADVLKRELPDGAGQAAFNEVMYIHQSRANPRALENQVLAQYQSNLATGAHALLALDRAVGTDEAKHDPQLAASIYRDMAIMYHAFARFNIGHDPEGARTLLAGDGSAKDAINSLQKLDPTNKDLPELTLIQTELLKSV